MRIIIAAIFTLALPLIGYGQTELTISSVCKQVSAQWKLDSNSCKGIRLELSRRFSAARRDSISKDFLFSTLGKPDLIQKYRSGYPDRKGYVEYIYYIYKDDCPKMQLSGAAIGFVFDASETYFIKMEDHDYCG